MREGFREIPLNNDSVENNSLAINPVRKERFADPDEAAERLDREELGVAESDTEKELRRTQLKKRDEERIAALKSEFSRMYLDPDEAAERLDRE